MTPETLAQLERIAAAGIHLVPLAQLEHFFVFERDGCFALVENCEGRFGAIGSPGLMTEHGFAPLIQRPDGPAFVCKGHAVEASPEQAAQIHAFFTQLKHALS